MSLGLRLDLQNCPGSGLQDCVETFLLQPWGIRSANRAPRERLPPGARPLDRFGGVTGSVPVSRGTWVPPLGDCAGRAPGLLTHRGVLREAEQGHVSVGAARPVVEEVGGEVGLS